MTDKRDPDGFCADGLVFHFPDRTKEHREHEEMVAKAAAAGQAARDQARARGLNMVAKGIALIVRRLRGG